MQTVISSRLAHGRLCDVFHAYINPPGDSSDMDDDLFETATGVASQPTIPLESSTGLSQLTKLIELDFGLNCLTGNEHCLIHVLL